MNFLSEVSTLRLFDEYGKFNHFQDANFVSAYHDAFESPDKSGQRY